MISQLNCDAALVVLARCWNLTQIISLHAVFLSSANQFPHYISYEFRACLHSTLIYFHVHTIFCTSEFNSLIHVCAMGVSLFSTREYQTNCAIIFFPLFPLWMNLYGLGQGNPQELNLVSAICKGHRNSHIYPCIPSVPRKYVSNYYWVWPTGRVLAQTRGLIMVDTLKMIRYQGCKVPCQICI